MLSHFLNDTYSNFLPAFLPLLQGKFGLSLTLVGLLASVYTIGSSLSQLLFGYLGDRLSRWNFVALGPLLTGLFMSSIGLWPSYLPVLLALLVAASGTAMFHPQAAARVGRWAAGRRGLTLSFFSASGTLGFALGPLLMALFIAHFGFARTYWAILPLIVVVSGLYPWMRRGSSAAATPAVAARPDRRQWRPLLLLWGTVVVRHTVMLSFVTFLIILLVRQGLGYVAGSVVLSGFLAAGALGGLLAGHLSDRLGRRLLIVIGLGLGFPLSFGFTVTTGPLSFALLILAGMALQSSGPVILAQAQEIAPANTNTASAVVMGLGWGTAGLLVVGVGRLADHWGILPSLQLVCSLAFVIFLGLAYALYHEERFRAAQPSECPPKP